MKPGVIGQRIADSVRVLSDAAVSALYRVEPESGRLVLQACSGEAAATFGWIAAFPPGTSMSDLAARSGRPAVTSDLLTDPRVPLSPESRLRIAHTEYRAPLCIPLVLEDTVVGTLAVGDAAGRVLDGEWVRPLQAFAAQAAVALEQSGAWEQARPRGAGTCRLPRRLEIGARRSIGSRGRRRHWRKRSSPTSGSRIRWSERWRSRAGTRRTSGSPRC